MLDEKWEYLIWFTGTNVRGFEWMLRSKNEKETLDITREQALRIMKYFRNSGVHPTYIWQYRRRENWKADLIKEKRRLEKEQENLLEAMAKIYDLIEEGEVDIL